jgi:nucleotide-binding universal stress UspA family protein
VVVGVSGSPVGAAALTWAAREAQSRGVPLALVRAWRPFPVVEFGLHAPLPSLVEEEELQRREAEVLAASLRRARSVGPDLPVTEHLVEGRAGHVLEHVSARAQLVVVGGNVRHERGAAWLGPVTGHLAGQARCPVVAVPAEGPVGPGPLVVGVDLTGSAAPALRFALETADRWGTSVTAVLALTPDALLPQWEGLDLEEHRARAGRVVLADALSALQHLYPSVPVQQVVSERHPLPALLTAAHDAALLVVGSRGHRALLRTALGSVSAAVLRSAEGPVAVVPESVTGL